MIFPYMIPPNIDILLATYNGSKFLDSLLESLFTQTYNQFRILARDDLSTDDTLAKLNAWKAKYPNQIQLIHSTERKGPIQSFGCLLQHSTAPYIMFCDQDDIWHRDKIEVSFNALKQQEVDLSLPLLIHTDLRVVDVSGNEIAPSFWNFSYLTPTKANTLSRYLMQNNVTGCTMIINRALANKALPIPEKVLMHDWWLAIVASAFGKVIALPRTTIDYRQHGSNAVGAQKFSAWTNLQSKFLKWRKPDPKKREQFMVFYEKYRSLLSQEVFLVANDFLKLPYVSLIKNRYIVWKHKFFPNGWIRIVAILVKGVR